MSLKELFKCMNDGYREGAIIEKEAVKQFERACKKAENKKKRLNKRGLCGLLGCKTIY